MERSNYCTIVNVTGKVSSNIHILLHLLIFIHTYWKNQKQQQKYKKRKEKKRHENGYVDKHKKI